MQSHEDTDGAIVVTYDSTSLSILLVVAALLCMGMAGYDSFIGSRGMDRLVSQLTGAVIFALFGLIVRDKTYFRFDPVEKVITWKRRGGFRQREGVIAFDDVRAVAVEVPIGDDGIPSRRICLHLADRSVLPLANSFHTDADDGTVQLANRLRMMLGLPVISSFMESVLALVDAGRTVEAVRRLIEGEGLSLIDAKTRVDEMRKRPKLLA